MRIFVDADACPVKQEIYRVARRFKLGVVLVANQYLRAPLGQPIEQIHVGGEPDAADDWIADNIAGGDLVITNDIPLAARCLERDAEALRPDGRRFDPETIGGALATRTMMETLREQGVVRGGPPPMTQRTRSRFQSTLDQLLRKLGHKPTPKKRSLRKRGITGE